MESSVPGLSGQTTRLRTDFLHASRQVATDYELAAGQSGQTQSQSDRYRVSFVVLSFNSARVLERCIRSLIAQSPARHDEVWVVENGSTDESPAILRALESEFPGLVKGIYLDRNAGTTVSRNLAIRRTTGQFVAIVDSDVYAPEGVVDTLLARMAMDHTAGLVAPRLIYPDGRRQLSVDRFPTLQWKVARWLALRSMEQRLNEGPLVPEIRPVDYAISAFWFLKREVVDQIGMLDERIFYSPEDVDYCIRVWTGGYRVLYDSSVHAVHDAQEVSRGVPWKQSARSHIGGLIYLFRKHGYLLSCQTLYQRIASRQRLQPASV
jgi:GT2 family glycosyltransferase